MKIAQNICSDDFLGCYRKFDKWAQKLGHMHKSKENLVNTLMAIFFYPDFMKLAQNVDDIGSPAQITVKSFYFVGMKFRTNGKNG